MSIGCTLHCKHTGLINVGLLHGLHNVVTFSMNLKMKCKTLSLLKVTNTPQSDHKLRPRTFKTKTETLVMKAKTMTKTFIFQYRDVSKPSLKCRELQAWLETNISSCPQMSYLSLQCESKNPHRGPDIFSFFSQTVDIL